MLDRLGMDHNSLLQRLDAYFEGGPLTARESSLLTAVFKVIEDNNDTMKR